MPRAIWRGAISFGMVSIPVRLYTATESKDISFRQLCECDGQISRVRQLRWCDACDREVPFNEIVRGYEYAKDQYVVLSDEDFDTLPVASKRTISIGAFVESSEIDPMFYDRTYYLEPDEAGVKPFALLYRAIEEKGLVAIGQVALRNRESLCALRIAGGQIVMETLLYPDEIREMPEVDISGIKLTDAEVKMAHQLVEMLQEPFEPEKYKDAYREALLQLISAKLEGGTIAVEAPVEPTVQVDLMAALRASIEAAQSRKGDTTEDAKAAADGAEADAEAGAESSDEKPAAKKRTRKAAAKK